MVAGVVALGAIDLHINFSQGAFIGDVLAGDIIVRRFVVPRRVVEYEWATGPLKGQVGHMFFPMDRRQARRVCRKSGFRFRWRGGDIRWCGKAS